MSPGGSPAGAPSASASTAGSPNPDSLSEDEALALVLAQDPRFSGLGKRDPSLIGQGSWYEVRRLAAPSGPAYEVTVRIGWGDCPAGCISSHTWIYNVEPDGEVRLVRQFGDELPTGGPISRVVTTSS